MISYPRMFCRSSLILASIVSLIQTIQGQPFTWQDGDVALGFRKTGANQGNYELVVDIGQATSYVHLSAGTTITVTNFTVAQLHDAFPTLNNLSWSVTGGNGGSVSGYPNLTLWLTVPRTDPTVQTTAIARQTSGNQQAALVQTQSILAGAQAISQSGVSNQDNTISLVREPINDDNNLTAFVSSKIDATIATLRGTLWYANAEVTTPSTFNSPVRSDFYEVRPLGFPDPNTGSTTGDAYYVGYFELGSNGVMTFTRGASVTPPSPPPPPQLTITGSGSTITISFATTNGATYSLYYTNSAGLTAPVSSWPVMSATIPGDGTTKSFVDQASDPNRVYRVGAR
jgi:hypothetical protein